MLQTKNEPKLAKFHSAEQLWFWFLYNKSVQNSIIRTQINSTNRVCVPLDIEIMITKLYLSGRLSDEQLNVMKTFGDKKRAPHQYIWRENRAAALWASAMETIGCAAKQRGWIE